MDVLSQLVEPCQMADARLPVYNAERAWWMDFPAGILLGMDIIVPD